MTKKTIFATLTTIVGIGAIVSGVLMAPGVEILTKNLELAEGLIGAGGFLLGAGGFFFLVGLAGLIYSLMHQRKAPPTQKAPQPNAPECSHISSHQSSPNCTPISSPKSISKQLEDYSLFSTTLEGSDDKTKTSTKPDGHNAEAPQPDVLEYSQINSQ